jgi:hypothetical protein
MLSRTTPALAAALLLAAAVPTAAHARFFEGETARGGEVTLDADDNGRPSEVTVRWRTRCHGRTVAALTALTIPPQTSRPRTFSVVRTDTIGLARGRYDAIVESAVSGASHGHRGAERWAGAFEATIRIVRFGTGRVVARCSLAPRHWWAAREGYGVGHWHTTSDGPDYVTGGHTLRFGPHNAHVEAYGGRRQITFNVVERDGERWSALFAAPRGRALAPGRRFTHVADEPFQDGLAQLDVYGVGHGCDDVTGEFTVRRARFDARGRMRAITISFVQYCEGVAPALRGTVSFRAAA